MIEKDLIILQKSADFFKKRPNDVILSMPRKGGGGTEKRSYLESAIFETCKISTFINMSFEST